MFLKISKYDRSLVKEQKSLDKYYCIDNGLRSAVLLPQSDDQGKKLENAVALELYRRREPWDKIYYYQGHTECDFVVQRESTVTELIQVTWDMTNPDTRQREINGLLDAAQATGCHSLTIITQNEETTFTENEQTICVIPAWKWMLMRNLTKE